MIVFIPLVKQNSWGTFFLGQLQVKCQRTLVERVLEKVQVWILFVYPSSHKHGSKKCVNLQQLLLFKYRNIQKRSSEPIGKTRRVGLNIKKYLKPPPRGLSPQLPTHIGPLLGSPCPSSHHLALEIHHFPSTWHLPHRSTLNHTMPVPVGAPCGMAKATMQRYRTDSEELYKRLE